MKEIIDIVKAYDVAVAAGKKTSLATVVLVEGSAYRRPGARMLITEDGELTGAISGGCLEGDALRKARFVIMQQQAMLVTYDTMDDDDAKLGIGLGCNGIIHILIEPIDAAERGNPMEILKAVVADKIPSVMVTLFSIEDRKSAQPGTCIFLSEKHRIFTEKHRFFLSFQAINDAERALAEKLSKTAEYQYDNRYTAFIEYVKPQLSLIIVGAGNDALPLTRVASALGWDITVIDGRPAQATPERFPLADRTIVSKPEQVLEHMTLNERTAFVLMTHNYNYELALLKELLPLHPPYLGILGPRKKLDRMLAELADNGIQVTEDQLNNIYGPVGLDIGAEGAEEIALSIAAEVKAVFANRPGYSLKHKPEPIHSTHLQSAITK